MSGITDKKSINDNMLQMCYAMGPSRSDFKIDIKPSHKYAGI